MTRTGDFLSQAMSTLAILQLARGDFATFENEDPHNYFYSPYPLLSALAHDALAFVDPRSPRCIGRVRELVPTAYAATFDGTAVSVRWSLHQYLASEESPDGTWRAHGRNGESEADAATTACASAALLGKARWQKWLPERRRVAALERMPLDPLSAAHVLRLRALLGGDTTALRRRVLEDLSCDRDRTTAYLHAVASAWRIAAPDRIGEIVPTLVPRLRAVVAAGTESEGRLNSALAVSALLDLDHAALVRDPLRAVIREPVDIRSWGNDSYGQSAVGSACVALAVTLVNVTRLVAADGDGELA